MKSDLAVYIYGRGLLNAAGPNIACYLQALQRQKTCLTFDPRLGAYVGKLDEQGEVDLLRLRQEKRMRSADRAVLLGVLAARQATCEANIETDSIEYVLFGSSRGATSTLEEQVRCLDKTGAVHPLSSPLTTAGCFASAIAHDLKVQGGSSSMSAACTTGLQVIHLASALIKSGQQKSCLVGASEAPNTLFTVRQMQALGVLSPETSSDFPCKPLANDRKGMVLGEGAVALVLGAPSYACKPLARILATATANDLTSMTGISQGGEALQRAIYSATEKAGIALSDVDILISHGTGTLKGDAAELNAYRKVFPQKMPYIAAHKWVTGHALAVSPLFSVVLASEYLRGTFPVEAFPYSDLPSDLERKPPANPQIILIAALGFGGNASVLVLASP